MGEGGRRWEKVGVGGRRWEKVGVGGRDFFIDQLMQHAYPEVKIRCRFPVEQNATQRGGLIVRCTDYCSRVRVLGTLVAEPNPLTVYAHLLRVWLDALSPFQLVITHVLCWLSSLSNYFPRVPRSSI